VPAYFREDKAYDKKCWWLKEENLHRGGVIVMQYGKRIRKFTPESLDSISEWLDIIHKCDIIHCDIRYPNVLEFKGKAQLIDFGLAKRLLGCAFVWIHVYGKYGRCKGSGWRVRKLVKDNGGEADVQWRIQDDNDMVAQMVFIVSCALYKSKS